MAEYIVQSEELSAVADAIREKRSTTGELIFPDGMVEAIGQIDTQLPTQEKTIDPSTTQVVVEPDDGKTLSKVVVNAIPNGELATPTISSAGLIASKVDTTGYLTTEIQKTLQLPTQSGKTVVPMTIQQIACTTGKYTTGSIYVQGDSNLVPSNIKSGVSIFGINGSYTGEGYPYGYIKQSLNFSGADTGSISSGIIYPQAFIIMRNNTVDSSSSWDICIMMVTGIREDFAQEIFTDYRSTTGVYRTSVGQYETSSTIASAYSISWGSDSIRVISKSNRYPFDGEYTVIIFGEDRS